MKGIMQRLMLAGSIALSAIPANVNAKFIVQGGNITFQSGTALHVGATGATLPNPTSAIASGVLSGGAGGGIRLPSSSDLLGGDKITVSEDLSINGNGATLTFTNPSASQIDISPNKTLTLQNITLTKIFAQTFNMGFGSKVVIGDNVTFELSEDLVFTKGQFQIVGTQLNTTFRGLGGLRTITLSPTVGASALIDIGANTLVLNNIELSGLKAVINSTTVVNGVTVIGSIALGGGSVVDVDAATGMSFEIQGANNVIKLLKNGVEFSGFLFYNHFTSENTLTITAPALTGITRVVFGIGFVDLSLTTGKSNLIFDIPEVDLVLKSDTSLITGNSGFIGGTKINILDFHIFQKSTQFNASAGLILTSNVSNAILLDPNKSGDFDQFLTRSNDRPTTAYQLAQREKYQALGYAGYINPEDAAQQQRPAPTRPRRRRQDTNGQPTRDFSDYLGDEGDLARTITLGTFNAQYTALTVQMSAARDTLSFTAASDVTKFGVDDTAPARIVLIDGSTAEQDPGATTTIKSTDSIEAVGLGNIVKVTGNLIMSGTIHVYENSELTIQMTPVTISPSITFATALNIQIDQGGILRIGGEGNVIVSTNLAMNFTVPDVSFVGSDAKFILTDLASMSPNQNINITSSGQGIIEVSNGASILLTRSSKFIVGTSNSDVFALNINNSGFVIIESSDFDGSTEATRAFLTSSKGICDVSVTQNGILDIEAGGVAEFNVANGVFVQGSTLRSFTLQAGGTLNMNGTAQLRFGSNPSGTNFLWDSLSGNMRGLSGASVQYFAPTGSQGFTAQLKGLPVVSFYRNIATTVEAVVRNLVQENSGLLVSTLMQDPTGAQFVRTKQGVNVALANTESVTGDNAAGTIFVTNSATGSSSTITPGGTKG